MAIIKSYNTAIRDNVSAANFPCLKYAWLPEDVIDGANGWVDRINEAEAVLSADGEYSINADGSISRSAGSTSIASGATYIKPGTKDVLMITIGFHNNSSVFELGTSSVTQGIGVTTSASADYTTADAGGYATNVRAKTSEVGVSGSPGSFGLTVDWGAGTGESRSFNVTEAGVLTYNAAGIITGININDGCSALGTERILLPLSNNVEAHGIYIFYFANGLPADIAAAVTWMTLNPNKGPWPAWVGEA